MSLISVLATVVIAIGNWQMFKKMGREGWESIIPFYNAYVLFQVLYGSGWNFLGLLVPFYNIYLYVKMMLDLGAGFNKSSGFMAGLLFLPPIFMALLGLDNHNQWGEDNGYNPDFVDDILGKVNDRVEQQYESEEVSELKKLKVLRDQDLLTEEEYDEKRKDIVNRL